jgi:FkbM family methyltransferase
VTRRASPGGPVPYHRRMSLTLASRLVARAARYRWKLNRPEIARMLGALPRGGAAIDIGAHKGAYSFWMGRRLGTRGRLIAVEPQERMVEGLVASLGSVGMTQATVVHAAASAEPGRGTINIPRDSTHGASMGDLGDGREVDAVPVRLVSIDELVESFGLTRLDFVKIDAEGHELEIVRGGLASFERFRPGLLVESEARAHEPGAVSHLDTLRGMLEPLGYAGSFNDGSRWLSIDEMDPDRHQNYGVGRFCNNIYFAAG